jgi:hypothetical protein
MISRHRDFRGLDYERDPGATDLQVVHPANAIVSLQVQWDDFLEGYFVRRAIQEAEKVDVVGVYAKPTKGQISTLM